MLTSKEKEKLWNYLLKSKDKEGTENSVGKNKIIIKAIKLIDNIAHDGQPKIKLLTEINHVR
jgi:hypothetical protein